MAQVGNAQQPLGRMVEQIDAAVGAHRQQPDTDMLDHGLQVAVLALLFLAGALELVADLTESGIQVGERSAQSFDPR